MRKGFTLIEMLVVLGILAIIFALGFPGLRNYIQASYLRSAVTALAQSLKQVGSIALTRSEPYHLNMTVNSGALSWTSDADTTNTNLVRTTLPYNAQIAGFDCSNSSNYTLSFTGRGMPTTGCSISVSLNGKTRLVTVLLTGKVVTP
ncbi:MAG: prepilin-type N-terminal cleavage/methylation domain-containing protein [Thermaceae bacterium]|nr:prepilin-type N-terminal cleavage/methylation domain-containing protein [Thermaceae bacterium]